MSSTAVGKVTSTSGRNHYFWPWHEAWRGTVEEVADQYEADVKRSVRPPENVMRELSGTHGLPATGRCHS